MGSIASSPPKKAEAQQEWTAPVATVQRFAAGLESPGLPLCCVGFDGYLDSLYRVVRNRAQEGAPEYFKTIGEFGSRVSACAGRSGDIEVVRWETRLGGNAPLMAGAMAALGMPTICVGFLGEGKIDEAFSALGQRCRLLSLGAPSQTIALEFDDGKIMLGELSEMRGLNWELLVKRLGLERLRSLVEESGLLAILNWSAMGDLNAVLRGLAEEVFPGLQPEELRKKTLFFDLSDPSARSEREMQELAELLIRLGRQARVLLSLNENELRVTCARLLCGQEGTPVEALAAALFKRLRVEAVVVHLLGGSLAVSREGMVRAPGLRVSSPAVSTGGGDNFNGGFCAARLLGLDLEDSLVVGNAVSSYYVSTGRSPGAREVQAYLQGEFPRAQAEG